MADKLLSAILAWSTGLQAACPKQEINFGSAAINLVVAWRKAMTQFGRPMHSCGPGSMFADLEADVLCGNALRRDMRAQDRMRVGVLRGGCRDCRQHSESGNQFMLYGKSWLWTAALDQRIGSRAVQRRASPHEE